jgi:hypothetical protein
MPALLILAVLVVADLAALRWGADHRSTGDWRLPLG